MQLTGEKGTFDLQLQPIIDGSQGRNVKKEQSCPKSIVPVSAVFLSSAEALMKGNSFNQNSVEPHLEGSLNEKRTEHLKKF
ncbi:hypothetical protein STEG23_001972 [Scotinomys teguina]